MAAVEIPGPGDLLDAQEVADAFAVDARTVTRWDDNGKLRAWCRTPGGHRRWRRVDVEAALTRQWRRGGGETS